MADTPITDYTKLDAESKATIAANAKYQGLTPQEYLTSRGGLYKSGYYGDTPEYRRIPDDLYAQLQAKGVGAINAEILNRRKEAYQKDPSLIEDPVLRMSFMAGRISIDDLMRAIGLDKSPFSKLPLQQIGALADGTPFYGWDSKGNPVTSPTGVIYSTTSSSDAISKFNSGSSPLSAGSSSTTASSAGFNATTGAYTASDGTKFTDQMAFTNYQKMLNETSATKEKTMSERRSAFQILREEFNRYGLGQLVGDVENLILQGTPPAEYAFQLRQLPTYKKRFAANEERIKKGLRALDEASYIALEDQYQDVMRRYGLPETYYQRDEIGTQKAFEKLIAADVSNVELERRIQNTQSRIFDANPEVISAMRQFYPGITNGEILAYALDPQTALPQLERKIAAAEIGGAALQAGLATSAMRAEELAAAGITKAAAQEQYGKISQLLPRAGTLAEIYKQSPYTQAIAETEAFGLKGATEATKQRRLLTELEQAQFSGQSGAAKGALARERAGQF